MTDRRNPFLILGVDFGASADEASAAFAKAARRLRRDPDATYSLEDATWALHAIEQAEVDPVHAVDHYRVPADPGLFVGIDALLEEPIPMGPSDMDLEETLAELEEEALTEWLADALGGLFTPDRDWAFTGPSVHPPIESRPEQDPEPDVPSPTANQPSARQVW